MRLSIFKALFCIVLFLFSNTVSAAGGIMHMMIAKEIIPRLSNNKLRQLLQNNMDAYLVGSNYPDSGYVVGTNYGEDSHWEPYLEAFVQYLRGRYADPVLQNPKIVAFLLGCATHVQSDIVFHSLFLKKSATIDFQDNWSRAHAFGDQSLDLFVLVERKQWSLRPSSWWVPVSDLLAIYQSMGKTTYQAKEIIWGNIMMSLAGIGERIVAPVSYPLLKRHHYWAISHYYDDPDCGILYSEKKAALYLEKIWRELTIDQTHSDFSSKKVQPFPIDNNILQSAQDSVKNRNLPVYLVADYNGGITIHIF